MRGSFETEHPRVQSATGLLSRVYADDTYSYVYGVLYAKFSNIFLVDKKRLFTRLINFFLFFFLLLI